MPSRHLRIAAGLALAVAGCSRSNNLLLGRVEATVGGHTVIVTDCYRLSVPAPHEMTGGAGPEYHFMPCRDAEVVIHGGQLAVNGRSYGPLGPGQAVTVDHGEVLVDNQPVRVR